MPRGDALPHLIRVGLVAMRARLVQHVPRILLLLRGERCLAGKANRRARFAQSRIHPDALVEDEALAIVVIPADFLEVFQDATLKLIDFSKTRLLHERRRLLTADAAGAKR